MKKQVIDTDLAKYKFFFDFDNTIAPFDVLDNIIESFSINKNWIEVEKAWKKGRIGSGDCLTQQLAGVRISKDQLLRYLSSIKIDPYFQIILCLLNRNKIRPVILSDNFGFIIKFILSNNGINNARIHANSLRFNKDRLIPSFPHKNRLCQRCAHCKKKNLLKENSGDKIIIYAGDGLSDICPAEHSDIVFAKASLLKHFRGKKKECFPFKNLEDIYKRLCKV